MLKFSNHWNYYFKGDLQFRNKNNKGRVISTFVDIITDVGEGKTKMYSGILTEYTFADNGDLATITITGALRYSFSKNNWIEIPGHCLIIPYEKIYNINLRYDIKKRKQRIRKETFMIFLSVVSIVIFLGLPVLIPYFFYYKIGLFRVIIGIILSLLNWIFLNAFIANLSMRKAEASDKKAVSGGFIILIFIFSLLTYLALK